MTELAVVLLVVFFGLVALPAVMLLAFLALPCVALYLMLAQVVSIPVAIGIAGFLYMMLVFKTLR